MFLSQFVVLLVDLELLERALFICFRFCFETIFVADFLVLLRLAFWLLFELQPVKTNGIIVNRDIEINFFIMGSSYFEMWLNDFIRCCFNLRILTKISNKQKSQARDVEICRLRLNVNFLIYGLIS